MFECAGEKPIEDEEESIEDDIGNDEFDLKEETCTKDELVEESVEKIFMSWSPEEIGNYYQLMCLQNEDMLWDLCMPTLQYSEENYGLKSLG